MLNAKQILVTALALAACMVGLTGCGQTGALYLPKRPAAPATPSAAAPLTCTPAQACTHS